MADAHRSLEPQSKERSKRILLVDDQIDVCEAMARLLRRDGYEIHVASSAQDAMRLLERQAIDIIVSDQRMPAMTGTAFLHDVQKRYPDTVRMILSGAADIDVVAKAMEDGAIYKFLTKPIPPALLRANVAEACSRIDSLRRTSSVLNDTVSGLPTSSYLRELFAEFTADAIIERKTVMLCMLRIDQYDGVASSFGRSFAREFSSRIASMLVETLGREWLLGHESPGVLLLVTTSRRPMQRSACLDKKLDELFARPLKFSDRLIAASVSVGATVAKESSTFDELVDRARAAMNSCSDSPSDRIRFFEPRLVETFRDRLQLESDLRRAVAENSFQAHYQPQIDLSSGQVVGVEALARWPHPARGFVSPGDFIPIAEETGLICAIGLSVLEMAADRMKAWRRTGLRIGKMAVNVSPLQLRDPAFVETVKAHLDRTGLRQDQLVIEITESAAIGENAAIAKGLQQLSDAGFTLAIDDFGTGYANLSHLARMAFKEVKIDRKLLPGRDSRSTTLFANIVRMARGLGLTVVAEGVETDEQLAAVRAAGCNLVQGFYFSPPVDADRIGEFIRRPLRSAAIGRSARNS